jgi:acetyl esterase/lipase
VSTDAFDPELRTIARILPRSLGTGRLIKVDRFTTNLRRRLASKSVPEVNVGSVSVRLHRPASLPNPVAALLWIHGGGYVGGLAAQDDKMCQDFVDHLGIVVASVDYRVAPEHPFPAGLHDCYEGLRWLVQQSYVDATRLAIGGYSAGGGLAAALALYAREQAEVPLRFQLLSYPMLDDRTAIRTDIDETNVRGWNNKANAFGWASYAGHPPGSDEISGLAAPSRAEDLSRLPPAWVGVGTLDLFHDEDVVYADRLQAAGVPCQLHVAKGAFHGFDIVRKKAQVSQAYRSSYMDALSGALR